MEDKWSPSEKSCLQGRDSYSDLDEFVYVASIKSRTVLFLTFFPRQFFSQFKATFLLRSLLMPTQVKKRQNFGKNSHV